jgi:hypothetical protein
MFHGIGSAPSLAHSRTAARTYHGHRQIHAIRDQSPETQKAFAFFEVGRARSPADPRRLPPFQKVPCIFFRLLRPGRQIFRTFAGRETIFSKRIRSNDLPTISMKQRRKDRRIRESKPDLFVRLRLRFYAPLAAFVIALFSISMVA